jgi:hypothetical protein
MTENEFVIEDIDSVMGSLRTGIPAELADSMSARLVQLADHFYTVAELLAIPDKEVEALAEKMGVALLNKQVKDAWYAGKGRVFIRGPELWSVYIPSGFAESRQAIYKPDEVPTEWRRQLGMLQLLEGRRTLLKDCGYRHDDKVFFLLEAGHGYDT